MQRQSPWVRFAARQEQAAPLHCTASQPIFLSQLTSFLCVLLRSRIISFAFSSLGLQQSAKTAREQLLKGRIYERMVAWMHEQMHE